MTPGTDPGWVRARRSLAPIAEALRGRACRIAFAGNSVTAQKDGYVDHLGDRLAGWSGHDHVVVRAGLSAMGSVGCLFTLDSFVVSRRPDVCFIECSVGDAGSRTPLDTVGPVLEGMIRKLQAAGCLCCILHAFRADRTRSDLVPLHDRYEAVAEHHGIATLDLHRAVEEAAARGEMSLDDAFLDGIHTRPAGARAMAQFVLEALRTTDGRASSGVPAAAPLHAEDFADARLLTVDARVALQPGSCRPGRFRLVLPYLEIEAGNGLRIDAVPGDVWGMLVVAGPRSGDVVVTARTTQTFATQTFATWDRWCGKDLIRSVVFPSPIRRGSAMEVLVCEGGGVGGAASTPKLFRLAGLMVTPGAAPDAAGGTARMTERHA